jgi:hypothetical protein
MCPRILKFFTKFNVLFYWHAPELRIWTLEYSTDRASCLRDPKPMGCPTGARSPSSMGNE